MTQDHDGESTEQVNRWIQRVRSAGLWILIGAGLAALFYAEENFRGELAWRTLKCELTAKGQRLDPAAFGLSPGSERGGLPRVDGIDSWFLRDGPTKADVRFAGIIEAGRMFDFGQLGWWGESRPTDLQEWRDYFRSRPVEVDREGGAGDPGVAAPEGAVDSASDGESDIVPMILIDDVRLRDALETLARHAGLELRFAASALEQTPDGRHVVDVPVSIHFEGVTAREAMEVLLANHSLDWKETDSSDVLEVIPALSRAPVWPIEALALSAVPLGPDADIPVSVITFDDVPALDAVRNVARHAGLNFQFDSELLHREFETGCSLRLTNVTTRTALGRVLDEFGLALQGFDNSVVCMVVPSAQVLRPASDHSAVSVREAFASAQDELETLYAAGRGNGMGVGVDPRRWLAERPSQFDIPALRRVAQALTLHASAELALGDSEAAFKDATALLRVSDVLRGQPDLVSAMIQVSLAGLYLQVIWEGLAARRWSDGQLRALQDQLQSIDLCAACFRGLEGEQAAVNYWLEHTPAWELGDQLVERITGSRALRRPEPWWAGPVRVGIEWGPRGWVRQLQVGYSGALQEQFTQLGGVERQRLFPNRERAAPPRWSLPVDSLLSIPELIRRHALNTVQVAKQAGRQQTGVRHALLACALERHRLAYGALPKSLDGLVPAFAEWLPQDLIDGNSYHYARTHDGQFVLFSPGWDQRDDAASGDDWVWRYPAR